MLRPHRKPGKTDARNRHVPPKAAPPPPDILAATRPDHAQGPFHFPAHTDRSQVWAIIPYFNPGRSEIRRQHIRTAAKRARIPVLIAELGFNGRFDTTDSDADKVIHFDTGALLWQKERLFNLALKHVPAACQKVVIMDADLVVADPNWGKKLAAALDRHLAVQPFADWASVDSVLEPRLLSGYDPGGPTKPSFAACKKPSGVTGGAWGYQRMFLQAHGLYDCMIVGGGDRAACNGLMPLVFPPDRLSEPHLIHLGRWARPFYADARTRFSYLPGRAWSLNHGSKAGRAYADRHAILRTHKFDPRRDLKTAASGCWEWAAHSRALAKAVADYFGKRDEDNRSAK